MDELEQLRQKRLAELQQSKQTETQKQAEMQQQIQQLEQIVKQKLTKEALSRYGNIRIAHPDIALQLIAVLAQLNKNKINDDELKEILMKVIPKKREIKIKRK